MGIPMPHTPGVEGYVEVAELNSLKEGHCRSVEVSGRRLAIAMVHGEYFAIDDRCPHRGGPLGAGFLEGRQILCPLHGWGFSLESGACSVKGGASVAVYSTTAHDGKLWVASKGRKPGIKTDEV